MRSITTLLTLALLTLAVPSGISYHCWDPADCEAMTVTVTPDVVTSCDAWVDTNVHLRDGATGVHLRVYDPAGVLRDDQYHGVGFDYEYAFFFHTRVQDAWPEGTYSVNVVAETWSGQIEAQRTFEYVSSEDVTPPTSAAHLFPSEAATASGWYPSHVSVAVQASDDCRLSHVDVRVNGAARGTWFTLTEDGTHTVEHRAVDAAGNEEAWQGLTVAIDATPPVVTITKPAPGDVVVADEVVLTGAPRTVVAGPVTLTADAFDATSGVAEVAWEVDGVIVGHGTTYTHTFEPGAHDVVAVATDHAGHVTASERVSVDAF